MRRRVLLFSVLSLLAACNKYEEIDIPVQDDITLEDAIQASGLPERIYATVTEEDEPETRTYVDGKSVLWHTGDEISYFAAGKHNAKYVFNGETGSRTAVFDIVTAGTTDSRTYVSYAVYPYNEDTTVKLVDGVETLSVVYPAEQTYAEGSFGKGANIMVAAGESNTDNNLYFYNACGYLVLKLKKTTDIYINKIQLTALGGVKIAGRADIVAENGSEPVVTMSEDATSVVTLDCGRLLINGGETYEFWFALPPVTLTDGIEVAVEGESVIGVDKFIIKTTKSIEIKRNVPQPMAEFEFTSNAPLDNELWYKRSGENNASGKGFTFNNDSFNNTIITSQTFYNSQSGYHVVRFVNPLTEITPGLFEDTDLTEIILPETLQTIGESAFEGCQQLTEITIPGSVTSIGDNAFYECKSLSRVTFKSGSEPITVGYQEGTTADEGTFYTSPLEYIYLDRDLNPSEEYAGEISEWDEGIFAIDDDYNVSTTVVLGNNVKTIHKYMFAKLPVASLKIPASVTSIGEYAFDDCDKLTTLRFEESKSPITIKGQGDSYGPFYDSPLTIIDYNRNFNYLEVNGTDPHEYDDDEDGIFAISSDARNKVTATESTVNIGPLINTIPGRMFCNLPITELTIPGTVEYIDNYVFNGCTKLRSLVLEPSPVVPSPRPLVIGETDNLITEDGPFNDCPLVSVDYNRNVTYCIEDLDSEDKGLFSRPTLSEVTIGEQVLALDPYLLSRSAITSITIPNTISTIGLNVFSNCDELATLDIEDGTNALNVYKQTSGGGADWGTFIDSPLSEIYLGRELSYIDFTPEEVTDGLFASEDNVETLTVTLSENVKTISKYMFADRPITEITIPASVELIDDYAFYDCDKLSKITFTESTSPLTIGFQDSNDEEGPFYQSPLSEINLYRQLNPTDAYKSSLDASDEGIFSCGSRPETITQLNMNDNVTSISDYMFYGQNLEMITIPGSVASIGKMAFANNPQLYNIRFNHRNNPPTLGEDVFDDCTDGYFWLQFVDSDVMETAKTSPNWPAPDIKTAYRKLNVN